jgi:Lon protease-like protein
MSILEDSSAPPFQDQALYLVDSESPDSEQESSIQQHGFMSNTGSSAVTLPAETPPVPLDGHRDARALVRLIQCFACSLPLRSPVTLPCGNSLCRQCLPKPHARQFVSYPYDLSRQQAILCPFAECSIEHTVEDCAVNVVFVKLLDSIVNDIVLHRTTAAERATMLEEIPSIRHPSLDDGPSEKKIDILAHSRTLPGARLASTFTLAEMGELDHTSDVSYNDMDPIIEAVTSDQELLGRLKETIQKDLDCHVCYNLMLNPITTPCGHSFCRKCLARILDHADCCPVCRRSLPIPASLSSQPSDKYLSKLLLALCPEEVQARDEAVELEERSAPGGLDTALFVVTVTFPSMPVLLHVFEPRYRLMIRRALAGNGTFGMVAHNQQGQPQGNMGRTRFMEVGVMVQIEHYQTLPDGRTFLQCRGISRFKIRAHGMLDGYYMARVEKIEDISIQEEEQLEARELSAALAVPAEQNIINLDRLSTRELFEIGQSFVQRARDRSAPWLQGRIIDVYGGPPEDLALFPYWFASVLPLHEDEKYKLLPTMSVRGRLKMTARWVHRIEAQRW